MNSKKSPTNVLLQGGLFLLAIILLFFIVYPPSILFLESLSTKNLQQESAAFTVFQQRSTWIAFLNTFVTATTTTFLTILIGGSLAWLDVKSDFPFKKFIFTFSMISFIIPPYILGLAWVQFLGRNGYLERMLRVVFTFNEYNFPYYSIWAVAIIMTLHLYPLMYISIRNSLKQQDKSLENAALLSGASLFQSIKTIILPLCKPSILATGLLIFSRTMANFTLPALLALPARKEFLTTLIYSSISGLDISTAATVSIFLVGISTALFWSQYLISKKEISYTSVGGINNEQAIYPLNKKKILVILVIFLFMGLTTILPLITMLISSFLKRWGLPLELQYFTLNNYRELFVFGGKTSKAFANSITYGVVAASLALVIGGATSYFAHSAKTTRSKILEAIATWPMAFPNIVLAVAAILAWNRGPLRLYGTPWAIILTYMVLFIPIVMKQVTGLIQNHDKSLLYAARLSGASPFKSFITITLPILSPGLKSGFIICFLIALREIPISLMLYFSGQETVGILLFGMQSQEYGLEMTSALSILIIVLLILGNIIVKHITRKHTYGKTQNKKLIQIFWNSSRN